MNIEIVAFVVSSSSGHATSCGHARHNGQTRGTHVADRAVYAWVNDFKGPCLFVEDSSAVPTKVH